MFYNFAKHFVAFFIKPLFPVKAKNADLQPTEGPFIVCANHISLLDAIFIAFFIKRPVTFLAKDGIFKYPVIRTIIKKLGAVPIKRDGKDIEALMTAIRQIKDNRIIMIFPQGKRFRYEETVPEQFKGGASFMSYFTKAPILPVGIATRDHSVRPFHRTVISFGEPITFESIPADDKNEFITKQNEVLSEKICSLVNDERKAHFGVK